jgi:hypothetical protein
MTDIQKPVVTDEMVEKAAKAVAASKGRDPGGKYYTHCIHGVEQFLENWMLFKADARAALTAVYPLIAAQVREECAEVTEPALGPEISIAEFLFRKKIAAAIKKGTP